MSRAFSYSEAYWTQIGLRSGGSMAAKKKYPEPYRREDSKIYYFNLGLALI